MNSNTARTLRKIARKATSHNEKENINVQVKPMETNNWVQDESGKMVREVVPNVTYTTVYKVGSYKKTYKELKKEVKNG